MPQGPWSCSNTTGVLPGSNVYEDIQWDSCFSDIQEFYEVTLLDNQRWAESPKGADTTTPINLWEFSSLQSTLTSDTPPSFSTSIEVRPPVHPRSHLLHISPETFQNRTMCCHGDHSGFTASSSSHRTLKVWLSVRPGAQHWRKGGSLLLCGHTVLSHRPQPERTHPPPAESQFTRNTETVHVDMGFSQSSFYTL